MKANGGSIGILTGLTLSLVACGGGSSDSTPPSPPVAACLNATPAGCNVLLGSVVQVASANIPASTGGTLTVSSSQSTVLSGTVISVPAGSLQTDTTIKIGQVSNSNLASDVLVTDIEPTGTKFDPAKPATAGIKYQDAYINRIGVNDTVASQASTLKVVAMDPDVAPQTLQTTINATTKTATANTTHLSYFAVLGYSKASLKGTYTFTTFDHDLGVVQGAAPAVGSPLPFPKGFHNGQGTVTFDGNGNWTASVTDNNDGVITSSTASGTYNVAADGTFTLSDNTGVTETGQVLAGGSTFAMYNSKSASGPGIVLGQLQIQSTFTNASLNGTYVAGDFSVDNAVVQGPMPNPGTPLPKPKGMSSTQDTVTFNGNGGWTLTSVENLDGVVTTASTSGTYDVRSDGAFCTRTTIDPPCGTGSSTYGFRLLAGGGSFSWAEPFSGNMPDFGFAVKQATAASLANLKGTYTVANFSINSAATQPNATNTGVPLPDPRGFSSSLMNVTFDGNGNWTNVSSVNNNDGTITTNATPTSGTYTVSASGVVTINVPGGALSGQVSADGSTFVLVMTTAGKDPEVDIGLLR